MASNGGTLHGVPPQSSGGHHICSHCGLLFDSLTSLQVHAHYQHEQPTQRWGSGSSASPHSNAQPLDVENNNNNNQTVKHRSKASQSPQHQLSSITSAAADSSDNQPSTPQPSGLLGDVQPGYAAAPYMSEMHFSGHYIHGYEQYYHHPHNLDYGLLPPPHHHHHHPLNNHLHQQEYKAVPSQRYHPYLNNGQVGSGGGSGGLMGNNGGAGNGLSPRIVSSSSPAGLNVPPGQPTPSPSPKQCDKCGMVCETNGQLIEHYATMHQAVPPSDRSLNDSGAGDSQFSYPAYPVVKEEPGSDILDLDSQKMVYNNEALLPSMHSLHHLQTMHRHHMMWNNDAGAASGYMAPQDIRSPYYPAIKPDLIPSLKTDYPPTPPTKNDYQIKTEFGVKPDFGLAGQTVPRSPVSQNSSTKSFGTATDGSSTEGGNQMPTSPQDFPSTTTPQENGGGQFRTFEAATSSLPNSTVQHSTKNPTWKSNEARRPKTYNCTACNKWFTSSGHLKRHYNTTLHKNAVKSSGHPDPATLPISVHHHPGRDPNYTGKGRRSLHHQQKLQQQQQQQQQQMLQSGQHSDTTQSPEYTPQYTLPGFSQGSQQGFQQYQNNASNGSNQAGSNNNNTSSLHSSTTDANHPNGPAGLSVIASPPRGLLNFSNNMASTTTTTPTMHSLDQQQLLQPHHPHQQLLGHPISTTTISSMGPYNTISPLTINTTTPTNNIPLYQSLQQPPPPQQLQQQHIQSEAQTYHHTIGNMADQEHHTMDEADSCYEANSSVATPNSMFTIARVESGAHDMYPGDQAPPFSPDIPEPSYQMLPPTSSTGSLVAAMRAQHIKSEPMIGDAAPPYSPAPCSPSITSTENTFMEGRAKQTAAVVVATSTVPVQHRCEQCDKVFNKACYLTQHNKTFHSGDKPFKCQRCGKRFSNTIEHIEHQAKHGGDKPFKCEVCPKQFNHKTDLRRHMCLHSGTKPYRCELCNKGFIRKDHMVKHGDTHRKKPPKTHSAAKKAQLKATSKILISSTTSEHEYM